MYTDVDSIHELIKDNILFAINITPVNHEDNGEVLQRILFFVCAIGINSPFFIIISKSDI